MLDTDGRFATRRFYSTLPLLNDPRAFLEISPAVIADNFKKISDLADGVTVIAVVKADGYGHTCEISVPALLSAGCDFFAVASLEEAVAVREIARKEGAYPRILIFGYTSPALAEMLARYDLIQTVFSLPYAKELSSVAERAHCAVRCHVKLDTGMNRIGFSVHSNEEEGVAAREIAEACRLPALVMEGIFTHPARAEEDLQGDPHGDLNRIQQERFLRVLALLEQKGIRFPCRHFCNGAGVVKFPREMRLDAVRFGGMIFGVGREHLPGICPAMKLKTIVTQVHPLLPGEGVSYGSTYRSAEPRMIATLPIGYADGFLRAYTGAEVTVLTAEGEYRAPVVGRVCMDQCMIDVTGIPVSVGDAVVIFGNDMAEIEELARRAGTIPYEVFLTISARVPRVIAT